MAANNSDFVLDDDLDDDEEILQIHSEQQEHLRREGPVSSPAVDSSAPPVSTTLPDQRPSTTSHNSASPLSTSASALAASPLPSTFRPLNQVQQHGSHSTHNADIAAVIVDGLPLSARRADLDALLQDSAASIENVRLRRMENHGLLRVQVQFKSVQAATKAMALDGTSFNGTAVTVKPASDERWNASLSSDGSGPPAHRGGVSNENRAVFDGAKQQQSAVTQSFWSAFGAARTLAERFEQRAKELGEQMEHKLHVSETIEDGKQRVREVDRRFNVSSTVAEFAKASRDTAAAVDKKFGFSDGVATVVEGVGGAARIVASEVDENLRVSDKARSATNAAMASPTVGGVARKVVSTFDAVHSPNKRSHVPRKLDLEEASRTGSGDQAKVEEHQERQEQLQQAGDTPDHKETDTVS